LLGERKVSLVTRWPAAGAGTGHGVLPANVDEGDVLDLRLPTLLLANKADLLVHPETDLEALAELEEPHFPVLLVSAETGQGLGALGEWLWSSFGLVRIYTKSPGKPALHDRPFTLRRGEQAVGDVARLVHRDIAQTLKYARVWGTSVTADGQHVGRDHVLADRDVVELHA
jgi:ribosome-interacting GTPase 1